MAPSVTTTTTSTTTRKNDTITHAKLGEHKDVQSLWVAVHGKGKYSLFPCLHCSALVVAMS
ncbi:hypothetical protein ACRALDRAFT_1059546 [Sodiomyces alcalophilus JCM 7366]|uniref:uncharacterized protein n=1 Tax=Sodiomyces alcalophilus JCM 7366 TaxID=591952 RepID=UPI0039B5BF67